MARTSTGTSLRATVATEMAAAVSAFLLADCTLAVEQPGAIRQTAASASAASMVGLIRISGNSFPNQAEEEFHVLIYSGLRPTQHSLRDQPAGHVVNHQRGAIGTRRGGLL